MSLEGSEAPRTARVSFLAYATQPVGRKIIAQCVSTGRRTVSPQPRNGAEELTRRPILSPRSGADNAARPLPTAVRRGLLSCALRALGAARLRLDPLDWEQCNPPAPAQSRTRPAQIGRAHVRTPVT